MTSKTQLHQTTEISAEPLAPRFTLEALVALSETQLMNIRNFGQKSVDEVKDKLVEMGLSLKDSVPGFDGAHFYGGSDDETI